MPTTKQKKLAEQIVNNSKLEKPIGAGQMLENVGYAKTLVKQPKKIIETEGVQTALANLGFTEENAKTVVSEILLNPETKDNDRLKAAEQVFKVHGSYAPEKRQSLNLNVEITKDNPKAKQLADDFENKFREELLDNA